MSTLELDGIFSKGYGIIAKKVMKDNRLSTTSKAIYAYLCSYSGKGKAAFPSQSLICFDLNISKSTLAKYIKELKDVGYIEVRQIKKDGKFSQNEYYLKTTPYSKFQYTETSVSVNSVNGKSNTNNNSINNNSINNNSINNNNSFNNNNSTKEKPSKKAGIVQSINSLNLSDEYKTALQEFAEHREALKAPLSQIALTKLINKLDKLASSEAGKIELLNESIVNGWKGVFVRKVDNRNIPLKDRPYIPTSRDYQGTMTDEEMEIYNR